ncbi:MAG: DUF1501 domain-containing protein [Planctomycetota bacterium]|nr:DUF1501 domain-containing protein [Planctomycetota bacterium]
MFQLHNAPTRLCDGITRRELMRIGGVGVAGLSLADLLRARETPAGILPTDTTFGRAKNLIYLYLQGGPPQHETFDPKPEAPAEIRGPFKPINTNVPGIDFCELLPRTARMADRLAVVRSMSTDDNVHSSSGYWVLTGYKYVGANARTIQPSDWPYFGSLVKMLKPSDVLPPLSTVWIPDIMRLNESVTPAGQTGGFLGTQWGPDRFVGDPNSSLYKVRGLTADIPALRLQQRASLLEQVEGHFGKLDRGRLVRDYDKYQQQAFEIMTSDRARKAFAIEEEPASVRDRYTRTTWGQSCLLARRLIESGVRMVHVNWPREPGDNAVDNPLWDTHAQNHDRVEDVLCPQFDVTFSTLIEDLDERGLLDETLVVAIGEFGRTPKINAKAGRDHWGPVFSFAMAGAGIRGGQVYGASDANGAYPAKDRVRPGELTASIFHLLGINWTGTFHDREGREHKLTEGQPLYDLLGSPTTNKLRSAGGEVARVPVFDPDRLLVSPDFRDTTALAPPTGSSRPKQWRAFPLIDAESGFGVRLQDAEQDERQVAFELSESKAASEKLAFLAQEVRSPFAGAYQFKVHLRGEGSAKSFDKIAAGFRYRLEFFEFTEAAKSPNNRKQLATVEFQPKLAGKSNEWQVVELAKTFVNPNPGSNFSFGLGLGVAVIVEASDATRGEIPAKDSARVVIDRVELVFDGKTRNAKVKV